MLVLTRKQREAFYVGDVRVMIVRISCGDEQRVRVGIEAPPGVEVDREEVRHAKQHDRGPKTGASGSTGRSAAGDTQTRVSGESS